MHRSTHAPLVLASTGVLLALALTGCSSGGPDTTPTATRTVTAAPSSDASSGTASAAPSDSTDPSSAPSATGSTSGGGSTGGGAAGGGTAASAGARCAASSLTGSVESGSGGAAGSVYVHLALRNTGTTTCTLQGWPGVSFVGDTNGTQIGNAASEDRASAHPTVTLTPGATAVAPLRITQTANYPAGKCDPTSPDGLRVYPPGSRESLFVPYTDSAACRSKAVTELQVQALVPQGQAVD